MRFSTEEQYEDFMRQRHATKPAAGQAGGLSLRNNRLSRKYRNEPATSADGKRFDSQLERDYYGRLVLRWKAGEIRWFIRQVPFELEGGVVYRADFLVVTNTGEVEVVDTTGLMTQVKANKLKQVKARYGIEVQLVRKLS